MNAPTPNLPTLYSMNDLERMATALVKSNLFGIKTMEQAVTLMLVAQAEGQHPATAARDYHVIQGRPALKADAMLARFQQAGGIVEWIEYSDAKVIGAFRHPQSPKPVLVEWTIEQAKRIGLATKDNWKNYPRQMLRARVISEGVRTCYPAIAAGIYTPEEVTDFGPEKDVTPGGGNGLPSAPITPTTGALAALTAERQEVVMATAAAVRKAMAEDRPMDAYSLCETSGFDAEEKKALWVLLPESEIRSALKRVAEAERAATEGAISAPQKKRMEALIKEHGLDREKVKAWCKAQYDKEHFSDLTPAEYYDLEQSLKDIKAAAAAA